MKRGKPYHYNQRYYFVATNAWWKGYLNDKRPEICFGFDHKNGGKSCECTMFWEELGGKQIPQLQVFDDSWFGLSTFTDLLAHLAKYDQKHITPQQFVKLLEECGFKPHKNNKQ